MHVFIDVSVRVCLGASALVLYFEKKNIICNKNKPYKVFCVHEQEKKKGLIASFCT
jgi:hypothetical protein